MSQPTALTDRQADYLDAIFRVVQEKQVARVKEIAIYLNVNRSTVSNLLPRLVELNLVNHAPHEFVSLTPEGTRIAEEHARKRRGLKKFFVNVLAVDYGIAETAARGVEKTAPQVVVDRLIQFGMAADPSDESECKWCEILKAFKPPSEAGAQGMKDQENTRD